MIKEDEKTQSNEVCVPLSKKELEEIFDSPAQEVIKRLIAKQVEGQLPKHPNDKRTPIFDISQTSVETYILQALGSGELVGAGSRGIDYEGTDHIADIKIVSGEFDLVSKKFTNKKSGESSLGQKFSEEGGNNLDELFKQESGTEIAGTWMGIIERKIKKELEKNPLIKNFYYFWFIKTTPMFGLGLVGFKINIENLIYVKEGKKTKKSVYLENFIKDIFGEVKIYSSKKRMEMRIYPNQLLDKMIFFEIVYNQKVENIRDTVLKEFSKKNNK